MEAVALFNRFSCTYEERKESFTSETVAIAKLQKTVDATEHLKISLESEEALKKVEHSLQLYT